MNRVRCFIFLFVRVWEAYQALVGNQTRFLGIINSHSYESHCPARPNSKARLNLLTLPRARFLAIDYQWFPSSVATTRLMLRRFLNQSEF